MTNATDDLIGRFVARRGVSPAARLRLRHGSLTDYAALAEHHYLRGRPVTATRVLTLVDTAAGPAERFASVGGRQRVAAVLVESLPALGCKLRDVALPGRYTGWSDRRDAARLINAELRCISRVVVDPQWRGLGLAVRLVREAIDTMTTPYLEALAAMGRVHPFFKLAGMREYRRPPHRRDQRLIDALAAANLEPWALADRARLRRALKVGDTSAAQLSDELARWAGRRLSFDEQLAAARSALLCEPAYYLAARSDLESTDTTAG